MGMCRNILIIVVICKPKLFPNPPQNAALIRDKQQSALKFILFPPACKKTQRKNSNRKQL
jgi:hypothetical protein